MNLFDDESSAPAKTDNTLSADAPLAARMRPRKLDEVTGQAHLIAPGKPLRRLIEADQLRSAIFWGPPGCGKSTLAAVIAQTTQAHFENFSAVTGGVADVRKIIEAAKARKAANKRRTLLFVDEIHRFNKAQQDAFLPHVEDGTVILIGATTENPYFAVNAPLLSRARIYAFQQLTEADIAALLERALRDTERGLGDRHLTLAADAEIYLSSAANGDARTALNALELAAQLTVDDDTTVVLETVEAALGRRRIGYDKTGDAHYDTISAFIKSIRGSDPDGAIYWLARMLEAGEEPRFIARRLVILASEDIGLADPNALPLANAVFQAVETIGLPECTLNLSHGVIYLACAPKSNACTVAIGKATKAVQEIAFDGVPTHLRDSHYKGAKALGHGSDYKYPHDFPDSFVAQNYLPESVVTRGERFYKPTENGDEADAKARLQKNWGDRFTESSDT